MVLAADRMVTVGHARGVEYEDSDWKIASLLATDAVGAVAVGAGSGTYVDEIISQARMLLNEETPQPREMETVLRVCLEAYQQTVRQTINSQVFGPLGYTLADLRNSEVHIPETVQKTIVGQVMAIRQETAEKATLIIAGVGTDGARIAQITGMDADSFTDIGYIIVGSGSHSARLTFTRRGYDREGSFRDGVFTTLEAKQQAEERQGVGQGADIVTVGQGVVQPFTESEKADLRSRLSEVQAAERAARQDVITDWTRPDEG